MARGLCFQTKALPERRSPASRSETSSSSSPVGAEEPICPAVPSLSPSPGSALPAGGAGEDDGTDS